MVNRPVRLKRHLNANLGRPQPQKGLKLTAQNVMETEHFPIGNKLFCLFSAKPLALSQALKKCLSQKLSISFLSLKSMANLQIIQLYSNKQLLPLCGRDSKVAFFGQLPITISVGKHNKT